MKIVQLIQNTPEWHAHRASHWNASDAPAMLGVSPYKTRAALLRELATGIGADVDAATQQRFDDGHRFEALARPLAEKIVNEDLYPCVGVEGRLSASFDGLTLLGDVAFEHKTLGAELRALLLRAEAGEAITGADLPEHYRIQIEQQCLVSGASRVLFMATRWEGDTLVEQFWCWYTPDTELRHRIVAGWEQFERDLAAYQPEPAESPKPIGRTPETLPSLRIEARGMVTASNLNEFREHAMLVLSGINRTLKTDEEFADAEQAVKWCSVVEDRLEAAKANVLGQMADVDAVCRTIDDVAAETRRIRLELDRLVKAEKESRKAELVRAGVDAVVDHYTTINRSLGEYAIAKPASLNAAIAASIKGLKTLASMRNAIDGAVAAAKIAASQQADRVRACIAEIPTDDSAILFPDRIALCHAKQPEDMAMLVAHRIGEHKRREEERERARQQREVEEAERLREQIRKEEEAKARAEFERGQAILREEEENVRREDEERKATPAAPVRIQPKPAPPESRIKLGDINAAIAPLSITADGLAQLGFPHVGTDRAAKLYAESSFEAILSALAKTIARADLRREAA